jgi:hypothetical protein
MISGWYGLHDVVRGDGQGSVSRLLHQDYDGDRQRGRSMSLVREILPGQYFTYSSEIACLLKGCNLLQY